MSIVLLKRKSHCTCDLMCCMISQQEVCVEQFEEEMYRIYRNVGPDRF